MVRDADRVEARVFHDGHLAHAGVIKFRRANRTVVVVHASAPEIDGSAVYQETFLRVPRQCADAITLAHRVKDLAVFYQACFHLV